MPTPITASAPAIRRQLPASSSRISAMSNMSAVPTGSAAARHDVGDLERRRGDHGLVVRELVRRIDDEDEKGERRRDGQNIEERPHRRRHHADHRGHAHVLAAAQRHHRTQHRQPQEQDRGQLVRPQDRLVEDITGDHAGQQDDDLRHHDERGGGLDGRACCSLERYQPLRRARGRRQGNGRIGEFRVRVHLPL